MLIKFIFLKIMKDMKDPSYKCNNWTMTKSGRHVCTQKEYMNQDLIEMKKKSKKYRKKRSNRKKTIKSHYKKWQENQNNNSRKKIKAFNDLNINYHFNCSANFIFLTCIVANYFIILPLLLIVSYCLESYV